MKFCGKDILYSDNHLLIVNKPAGIPTQTEGSVEKGLDFFAKEWIKETCQKAGNVFLEPAHRLDKPVSGLVLFARTSKALSRLQQMMRDREVEKNYYALIEGALPHKQGVLEHYLIHEEHRARVVPSSFPGAKQAILDYRLIETRGPLSLIEIKLETGRYHQIRAQLSVSKCPIVGDRRYGSFTPFHEGAIALHHGKLAFLHPVKKEQLEIESLINFM